MSKALRIMKMETLSKVIKNYFFEAEQIPAGRGEVRIIWTIQRHLKSS